MTDVEQKGAAVMLFSDEQTAVAIDIIHMLKTAIKEKKPLPGPEETVRWESEAKTGNEEAYRQLMCAKLHMMYPAIPEGSGTSDTDRLWRLIVSGHLESILVVNSLDYIKAYDGYEWPPRPGSYFERWLSSAVKNELNSAIADGWDPVT